MGALARSGWRMLSIISRNNRRFSVIDSRNNRRFCSTIISEQPKLTTPPPPPPPEADKNSWGFLKYGLIAALSGGAATAGYATYAYSADEIVQKTKAFRASANFNIGNDGSSFDRFQAYLRAAAVTVPAKLVNLYLDIRSLTEEQIRVYTEPISDKLLPDLDPAEQHVFTLVLDLNDTLIYSDWTRDRGWRTYKRPGVDAFLEHLAQFYEIVVYSDQTPDNVNSVVERLDQKHCIRYRLSRGATRYIDGKHYRDLSTLNRNPGQVLYISGHALESSLQQENCVPIKAWEGEAEDTALLDLIPFLDYVALHRPSDIRTVLSSYRGRDVAKEFIERSKGHQRRMQEQKQQGHRLWRR